MKNIEKTQKWWDSLSYEEQKEIKKETKIIQKNQICLRTIGGVMDKNWVWMGHAGHLIVGNECQFRLNTNVGKYIVSTVGEYVPDSNVREILAESRGIKLEGKGDFRLADWMKKNGYENIGFNRKYETMVFKSVETDSKCCPYRALDFNELDFCGYNLARDAYFGHIKMCDKWNKK